MNKVLIATALILLIMVSGAFAADKIDRTGWVEITGVYTGDAVVKSDKGFVMDTPITLHIRKGEKGKYIIEFIYFKDKVAKVTKCARIRQYKVSINDRVESQGKQIHVTGAFKSDDGKVFSGGIRYVHVVSETQKIPLRSFTFDNVRLAK